MNLWSTVRRALSDSFEVAGGLKGKVDAKRTV